MKAFNLILVLLVVGGGLAGGAERSNIVFIFTDDHAWHAMGTYGSEINETPNLDRLAAEGMRFDRCLVTNSICGPSRAVVLTGKHSHLNGFLGNANTFDGSQQTAPKLLQKAGYATAMIGKWHLKSTPTGFDHFDILIGQGKYYNAPTKTTNEAGEVVTIQNEGYATDMITDKALEWLENGRDDEKPFLLMCQHKAPHGKWEPPLRHLELYADEEIAEPASLFDDYEGRASGAAGQAMNFVDSFGPDRAQYTSPPGLTKEEFMKWHRAYDPDGHFDRMIDAEGTGYRHNKSTRNAEDEAAWQKVFGPRNAALAEAGLEGEDLVRWRYQRYIKNYLRCVTAVDENIGRVLDYLDENGLAENTVVIYSSDQGFYLGDHGWFDKRWIYEESLRTPLIARWPGGTAPGTVNEDIVSNLDFAETFLDIAGVKVPKDMQGASLVPLLKGETPEDWRTAFYYHYYEGDADPEVVTAHNVPRHYGVVTDRFKLVNYYELGEWELFDRESDPEEMRSQYANPEYEAVREELEGELKRLREAYAVPEVDPDRAGR
jgi:arylsulfatase A-like enzyme